MDFLSILGGAGHFNEEIRYAIGVFFTKYWHVV